MHQVLLQARMNIRKRLFVYKNQFPYSIEIVFKIENTKLPYDCNTVLASCPALSEQISKIQNPSGTITINLPKWIKRNDLLEYFFYFKNGIVINNKDNYYRTMLKLSDFFNNCDFLEKSVAKICYIQKKRYLCVSKSNHVFIYLFINRL